MRDPHVLVVWQGRVGDHSPYADWIRLLPGCESCHKSDGDEQTNYTTALHMGGE